MSLDLDTRLLRMFVTLAKEGNHTRTGKTLHLTQSAVSHGMKRLEEQLGCSLIYTKGKTTRLTPEGRQFLSQATKILENLDQATEALAAGEAHTTLSIVFSASMAHAILAPVLSEFRRMYPYVVLGIRLEDSADALQEVEDGRADLAIVIDDNLSKGLKTHSLFRDTLCFLFSPNHPWAGKQEINDGDLKEEHFLLYRRDSVTFRRVQDLFYRSGMSFRSYVEIPSFDIIKQVAQLGLGVALMAPWVAAREIAEGSLLALPTPRFQIGRHWKIIQQEGREIRQAEHDFIACCRSAVKGIPLGIKGS
jgi:LysR family transcriptional regulator, low CO2-responsive transcriptional regulator